MKNFIFFLFLFSTLLYGQNKRFFYSYDYLKDTTNILSWTKLNMILDVGKDGSRFMDYDFFQSDSLRTVDLQKNINYNQKWGKGLRNVVIKEYPKFGLYSFVSTTKNILKVNDDRKILWNIEKETLKVGNFTTQKATTTMFGRQWTAWFTTEIPIFDGPYKFHGLPGLIVKLEDYSKTHKFELMGIRSLNNFNLTKKLYLDARIIEVNQTQYKKIFTTERNNTNLGEYDSEATTIKYYNSENKEISKETFFRTINRNRIQSLKTNNNPLEMELLKK